MRKRRPIPLGMRRGITLRQVAPNAITAMALCFGLTGIRYGIAGDWERAVAAIIFAGVLDGIDGRVARMLSGESRFGAELDSLSDVIAFGVSPAIILYLWSLQEMPRFGWIVVLAHALACALRLARYNANIDVLDQPKKAAGFLTGVPAPAGAGLAFLPLYAWFVSGMDIFKDWKLVAPWLIVTSFLMVSNVPTLGWKRLRLPPEWRLFAIGAAGLFAAMLMVAPWISLLSLTLVYATLIPFGVMSYARVTRRISATSAQEASERIN
ncbi:CDP-alcohol phosphatidyltransferase family protein [Sphingobium sp. CR28]|uniref:CDP-alcohol phosphatidyltransferase family protein n=1 Tax=Sphingobium sp. CR28 TaxID=3400272 RepID=UPI003FEDBC45